MRNFRLPEIRVRITTTHPLLFLFLLNALLCLLSSAPAQAQYYLADSNPQSTSTEFQNIECTDVSCGVNTEGGYRPAASDECMGGFISTFLSIAGVCIGIPLLAMCFLGAALGKGVNSARLSRDQICEVYLNAEPTPLRRYDPQRKHLLESIRS